MANEEHLAIIKQGGEVWNQWRLENPKVKPDFSGADLTGLKLCNFNLNRTNLSQANLPNADLYKASLCYANLTTTNFFNANFHSANLYRASLCYANLSRANLIGTNLHNADLSRVNLSYTNLRKANLIGVNLSNTNLIGFNLSNTNLRGANLSHANLSLVQALSTNFCDAKLTGACLENLNINSFTNMKGVICEYIYLKDKNGNFTDRRPSSGVFGPDDFRKLVQKAISTVDLIFRNGINWEAFAQSFQRLQAQTGTDDLDIQSIENKGDGDFVIRMNVPLEADKAKIQEFVMEEYGTVLKTLEAQYEKQLRLQGERHAEQIQHMIEAERQEKATLLGVLKAMANSRSKFDLRGAHFSGGFAETVRGNQIGGQVTDINADTIDISKLVASLRSLSQSFSEEQREEVAIALDDLEGDLRDPKKQNPLRLKKRLIALCNAAVIESTSDFGNAVLELVDRLGVSHDELFI